MLSQGSLRSSLMCGRADLQMVTQAVCPASFAGCVLELSPTPGRCWVPRVPGSRTPRCRACHRGRDGRLQEQSHRCPVTPAPAELSGRAGQCAAAPARYQRWAAGARSGTEVWPGNSGEHVVALVDRRSLRGRRRRLQLPWPAPLRASDDVELGRMENQSVAAQPGSPLRSASPQLPVTPGCTLCLESVLNCRPVTVQGSRPVRAFNAQSSVRRTKM